MKARIRRPSLTAFRPNKKSGKFITPLTNTVLQLSIKTQFNDQEVFSRAQKDKEKKKVLALFAGSVMLMNFANF